VQWWLPDRMEVVKQIPKTSVGKFSKKELRVMFQNIEVP
jgi:fatty-acyl-CoA synthase